MLESKSVESLDGRVTVILGVNRLAVIVAFPLPAPPLLCSVFCLAACVEVAYEALLEVASVDGTLANSCWQKRWAPHDGNRPRLWMVNRQGMSDRRDYLCPASVFKAWSHMLQVTFCAGPVNGLDVVQIHGACQDQRARVGAVRASFNPPGAGASERSPRGWVRQVQPQRLRREGEGVAGTWAGGVQRARGVSEMQRCALARVWPARGG